MLKNPSMMTSNLRGQLEAAVAANREQVQIALALAEEDWLISLLADCTPAIAHPHQLGQVRVAIGIPPQARGVSRLDGVLEYEQVWCLPAMGSPAEEGFSEREYASLTRCQSELKTLAWRVKLSEAIALLQHGGLQADQIQRILQLPWEGWHRAWWDLLEPQGTLGLPFQRWFRTRCYSDGTYTLQYQDHYAQDEPPCFRGIWRSVPLLIREASDTFGDILTQLRQAQHSLKSDRAILISSELDELAATAYMRQGVSLYPLEACQRSWSLG